MKRYGPRIRNSPIVQHLKHAVRTVVRTYPVLEPSARRLYLLFWRQKVRFRAAVWRQKVRFRAAVQMRGIVDPNRTLQVDPNAIQDRGPGEGAQKVADRGKVIGGDWDRWRRIFAESNVYRAMVDRFTRSRAWEETDYYQRLLRQVAEGANKRGMTSAADVDARCATLDRLYKTIRDCGYEAVADREGAPKFPHNEDEVTVRVSREGDLLFQDGRHRLSIAKILGIHRIPVKVSVRHRGWFQFIQEIHQYARQYDDRIYNVISHPDLDHIPARHGWDRFTLIRDNLPPPGSCLDVGCHWGFYCHQLEQLGFDCTGVEIDLRAHYFAERLKRAERRRFRLVCGSVFDLEDRDFDLVLALYIFHHFTKTAALHSRLTELLRSLNMRTLVLGCHNQDQPAMSDAYRNYSPPQFVEFVLEHSCLTRARHIGTEAGRRELYLLER